ncbi:hypothetical protein [Nocardioides jejuensis]|nr:hypothetical protein [Nocardioides jejuensis]
MYIQTEILARELIAARLAEAERIRRRRRLVRAAYDARLALGRVGR